MKQSLRLLSSILILLLSFSAFAGEYDGRLREIDDLIRIGQYYKALEKAQVLSEKLDGKNTPDERAILLMYKARIMNGLCRYEDMSSLIHDAIQQWRSHKTRQSPEYCYALIESAKLYIGYGMFVHASEDIEEARMLLPQLGLKDSTLAFALKEQEVGVALSKGFLNEADKNLKPLLVFYQNIAETEPDRNDDPVTGRKKSKADFKREVQVRKETYARMLLLKASVQINKGDYEQANLLIADAKNWIKKNIGTKNESYLRCLEASARNAEEYGYYEEAVNLYKKAINAGNSSRTIMAKHKDFFSMYENMIRSALNADKDSKAKSFMKTYEEMVKDYYPEETGYQAKKARMEGYIAISQEELDQDDFMNILSIGHDSISSLIAPIERLKVLYLLQQIGINIDSLPLTKESLFYTMRLKKQMYGTSSPHYQESLIEQAYYNIIYDNKLKESKDVFENIWLKQVKPQLSRLHKDYPRFLNMQAKYYELTDQYAKANKNLEEAKTVIVEKHGEEDLEFGHQLEKMASINIRIGNYKAAEEELKTALDIVQKQKGKYSRDYISVMRTLAKLYVVIGWYNEADALLTRSFKLQKIATESPLLGTENMNELIMLYFQKGLYAQCEQLLNDVIYVREQQSGASSQQLIEPLNLLGRVYLAKGDFTTAEKLAKRTADISSKIFGDSSSNYIQSLALMQRVYATIGDQERSEALAKTVLEQSRKQLGKNHIEVARATTELALAKYRNNGKPSETENLLKESIKVTESILGDFHPQYADGLKNLAFFYIDCKRFDDADSLLTLANEIWRAKLGKSNAYTAEVYMLKGDLLKANEEYKDAEKMYNRSRNMYESLFGNRHPQYVQVLSRIAQLAYIKGDNKKLIKTLNETTKIYLEFITKYFPSLSDREKTKFWNLIKPDFELYSAVAVKLADKKPELLNNVYNFNLATKALLLNSSLKIKDRILRSNDAQMITKYREWIAKKEQLTNLMSKSSAELTQANIDLPKVENEVENLEKVLSEGSEVFAQSKENVNYTWKDVKKKLKDKEYSVELIRYRYFDTQFTDSVIYVALVVSAETKKYPTMVVLPHGNRMENQGLKYYRNCMKYGVDDETSYEMFWQPIKEKIDDNSTIYLSAEGVYNQINLETIPLPNNGGYVLDRNNIVLLSNSKDLLTAVRPRSTAVSNAYLFGNPVFYASTDSSGQAIPPPSRGLSMLPGTELEIQQIDKMLRSNRWIAKSYTAAQATEDEVKNIKSPRVLHVATHGFFLEDVSLNSQTNSSTLLNESRLTANPLLRSGLLFKDAGDILKVGNASNYNLRNGILTAYEAMNLNLDNTELVVLSACETGLGTVKIGEGVYGLQRAFLVAGAHNVIMSLFKVPDETTQKLMSIFYEKWISSGDKRSAFIEAKKQLKKQYPQPIYWGSFVMMGL